MNDKNNQYNLTSQRSALLLMFWLNPETELIRRRIWRAVVSIEQLGLGLLTTDLWSMWFILKGKPLNSDNQLQSDT